MAATYPLTRQSLFNELNVSKTKVMLTPGPSNAHPRVCAAGSQSLTGHLAKDFIELMDDVKAGLQYAFQTTYPCTLAVSGTGHAAMECAIMNLVEEGETVMTLSNGVWGMRVANLCRRLKANVVELKKPYGDNFTVEEIEAGMKEHKPAVIYVAHSESSGGTIQPVDKLGVLCRQYNCVSVVDTVASLAGVPIRTEEWQIDCIYSGAQKCLSCPPGASPISFGPRALEKVRNRKTKPVSFYFDIMELQNYWGCDENNRRYHHTAAITSVYQLREGLRILAEETLESFWQRHNACTQLLWQLLQENGFDLYVKDPAKRLITVNLVKVPEGVSAAAVQKYLLEKYDIEISGGLGECAGKVWRVGLMGVNAQEEHVRRVVKALVEALPHCKL